LEVNKQLQDLLPIDGLEEIISRSLTCKNNNPEQYSNKIINIRDQIIKKEQDSAQTLIKNYLNAYKIFSND